MVNFNTYQVEAHKTAVYPQSAAMFYPALGLCGEAGEVAEKIKKYIRDGKVDRAALQKELGDVAWYLAELCTQWNFSLEETVQMNLEKLRKRQGENKLHGSGDER